MLITKALGISPLSYSASNVDVPDGVIDQSKRRRFQFLWKNKRDKIKRIGLLYQDYDKGGLHMVDFGAMIKALRLTWIPRLLNPESSNRKTVPNFFRKCGGLNFFT